MVLCTGHMGRLGVVGLRASRQSFGLSQLRTLSTAGLQRSRLTLKYDGIQTLYSSHPRSFWNWSKPAGSAPATIPATHQTAPTDTLPAPELSVPAETLTALEIPAPAPDAIVPGIPTEVLSVDLPTAIPPLNYGDLAALGLASWTPTGICRWTMELINVSTGMPWVWTIVAATVLSRVVLFPFTVKQMQSTAALAPYQAEIAAIREEMSAAQQRKDMLALQRVALRQKLIYEKAGVSLVGMSLAPFVQLPVTLGMFFGVKALCELPVQQLKWSGLEWLPDLTVADPTMVLPIAATLLMNVQISVTMRDLVGGSAQMGHVMNFLRILTMLSVFLIWNLPSGVVVYLIASISAMIAQSLLLRQAAIRRLLRIPVIPEHLRVGAPTMRESLAYAKKWWSQKVAETRVPRKY